MRHVPTDAIEYGPVSGVAGVETLAARRLTKRFDRHFHDTYSFGLILAGVESCAIARRQHFFEPGTVAIFNPGEVHDGGPATAEGWTYRMVYVHPALVAGERAFTQSERRDASARQRVAALFDAIDCGSVLGIEEALQLALDTLLGARHRFNAASPLADVRDRIDAECEQPMRLKELCAIARVSPTRLLRGFEAAYGLTPHRYQQSRRIAKAKRMIIAGTPLAAVATACGYSDQTHLNRWFLRIQGTTPGRFRRAFFS